MGFSVAVARGFLTVRASLIAEHRLWGTWASVVAAPGLQGTGSVIVVNRLGLSVARGIFPDQGSKPCLLPWWKLKVLVAQSCLTLCDLMDYSPPGSTLHGIFQASDSDSKECACNVGDQGSILSWEDPLEKWQPIPVFLTGEFHGQRSLAVYRPWGCKELATTEWLSYVYTYTGVGCDSLFRGSAYPEIEPSSLMSPVFAGRLFPTEPSREPGWRSVCVSYFLWFLLPQVSNKSFVNHDALCPNYCSLFWVFIQGHHSRIDSY